MRFYRKRPVGTDQENNRLWWEQNPMVYDWNRTMTAPEGTPDWFREVDHRFYEGSRWFGHRNYPKTRPFSQLIDYETLAGKRVLEVGCGAGTIAGLIAGAGATSQLVAMDLSSRAAKLTRQRFDLFQLRGDVLQSDGQVLPFPDCTFDCVWSWGVIHHSANPVAIIEEISRILKPGGECKVMVYNRHSTRYMIYGGLYRGLLRGELLKRSLQDINMAFTDGYFAWHFTARELTRIFSKASFRNVSCRVMDQGDFITMFPGWGNLTKLLWPIMLPLNRALMHRWGWFLFVESVK